MAYKKQEIIDLCLEVIEREDIIFQDELIAYIPISESTFYQWKLGQSEELKRAINSNKIVSKATQRKNWRASENATLQLASYRLSSTEEERRLLATNYTDITTGGEKILPYDMSDKDRAQKVAELRGELNSD